ncbi:hypothetical protein SAMN05421783_10515 [Thiocapsa roseopersicina]|uniref:Uncharacterized protein n=1 Tax=Thiocapsa roseopersicina TaxID=1058 RepID=A0A1H2U8I9_THIRO|nr:hypothetical protein SAMN05421783_10515 [Thiocapsa roseopersicina]
MAADATAGSARHLPSSARRASLASGARVEIIGTDRRDRACQSGPMLLLRQVNPAIATSALAGPG